MKGFLEPFVLKTEVDVYAYDMQNEEASDQDMQIGSYGYMPSNGQRAGKVLMDAMIKEWMSQVLMNLMLSMAMQHVMHVQWYLLGAHLWGSSCQKEFEQTTKENDVYALDLDDLPMDEDVGNVMRALLSLYEMQAKLYEQDAGGMGEDYVCESWPTTGHTIQGFSLNNVNEMNVDDGWFYPFDLGIHDIGLSCMVVDRKFCFDPGGMDVKVYVADGTDQYFPFDPGGWKDLLHLFVYC